MNAQQGGDFDIDYSEIVLDLIEENHELRLKLAESMRERLELLKLLKDVGISK